MRFTIVTLTVFLVHPGWAKDLPRMQPLPAGKAAGCEWAGPGFAKVEGTATCVKVGGSVRAEVGTSSAGASLFPSAPDR